MAMVEAFDIETYYTYEGELSPSNLHKECMKKRVVHVCAMAVTAAGNNGKLIKENVELSNSLVYDDKTETFICYGTNEQDQIAFFQNLPATTYATWNGARFDNHCIIFLLHMYGFKYEYMYQKKSSMLSLKYQNKYGWVVFKDYCKVYSGSLAKLTKELSPEAEKFKGFNNFYKTQLIYDKTLKVKKHFKLSKQFPKIQGKYNYKKHRPNASDFNSGDRKYVQNDVVGLKIAVNKLDAKIYALGMDPTKILTAGSLATKYMKKDLKKKGYNVADLYINHALVDYSFVAGGIVNVNRRHRFKVHKNVHHYDIVSFYPFVMSKDLPYGEPIEVFNHDADTILDLIQSDNDYLYFLKTGCKGHYASPVSPLFGKDKNGINTSLTFWDEKEIVPIPDPVLRSPLLRLYDGDVYVAKYRKMPYLRDTVHTIFEKKTEAKMAGDSALSWTFKIIINSLSGKFMQKPIDTEYEYIHNECVQDKPADEIKIPWHVYLPTASYITSYAREMLCSYIHGLGDNFLYCDTDSVFFKEEGHEWLLKNGDFGEELGQLSLKDFTVYDEAAFLGKKCYIAQKGDKKKSVIAGLHKYPFDTVSEGVDKLLRGEKTLTIQSMRCVQGVVLADVMKGKIFNDASSSVHGDDFV